MRVPFCDLAALHAPIRAELAAAYDRVMTRGQFILGEEVEAFEREWANYCGAEFCVGVGNGLDALRLMLEAEQIGTGDEVIVPSNTYIATWLAVMVTGARPIPVEPDGSTWNIDPALVERAITYRTRAILAVHLYGRQAPMEELAEIADRRGIVLFADAAQGHGIKHRGDASGFSFYPTKNLGAFGDGGAVVTNSPYLAERVRALRNYGSTEKNCHWIEGANSRLDELQAAFLRVKLPHLAEWNMRRMAVAVAYDRRLSIANSGPVWRPVRFGADVHHLYVAVVEDGRDELRATLLADGIETAVHYPTPPHLQPACARLGYKHGSFPIAERLAAQSISLPIGPYVSAREIDHVTDCFTDACERIAA